MRTSFLSRLMLGGALVATIALCALAMRAALPIPETRAASAAQAAAASDAGPILKVERSDTAPVAPASGASALPAGPAGITPEAEAMPASNTGGASTDCAGERHQASSCPYAGDAGVATRSPAVAIDGDHPPARTSARASSAERRVSSGPMRMLGGGESTW